MKTLNQLATDAGTLAAVALFTVMFVTFYAADFIFNGMAALKRDLAEANEEGC